MTIYSITHTDYAGEVHQLIGHWMAASPAAAIAQMLSDSGGVDDGRWDAHQATTNSPIPVTFGRAMSTGWAARRAKKLKEIADQHFRRGESAP